LLLTNMTARNPIETEASKAIFNRIWSHTVGIVNESKLERQVGKLPDGRRVEESPPGTGCLIQWGSHSCILTAGHVVQSAAVSDLKFFIGSQSLKEQSRQEVESQAYVEAYQPRSMEIDAIFRCSWEDMTVLTVPPGEIKSELHTLKSAWADPQQGAIVQVLGFPTHKPLALGIERVGDQEQRTIGLTPTYWDGRVVPVPPRWEESSFSQYPYDPEKHFFTEWKPIDPNMGLKGFSGAAAWTPASVPTGKLWSPKLLFAGMCTHYYGKSGLGRMIKASVVLRFLEEILASKTKVANRGKE
jgi:hypothetical protein